MNTLTFDVTTLPRQCPLPCSDCTANLEVSDTETLYEFAELIVDAFGFDFDHAFGFYENLSSPYADGEKHTLFADVGDDEGAKSVSKTKIADVFKPGSKRLFLFDYGDDWHFLVTCTNSTPAKAGKRVARCLAVKGQPPTQYPDFEE